MVAQLRILQLGKGKGKVPGRSQQAVDELDYFVTFNRSITQAMTRIMQDLSEGVFVNMANLTLARRDSYLEFLTPAHKGWGYSRPLRRPGGGRGHKACGCSTAETPVRIFTKFSGDVYPKRI